jgi:hypothetical protein
MSRQSSSGVVSLESLERIFFKGLAGTCWTEEKPFGIILSIGLGTYYALLTVFYLFTDTGLGYSA